MKSLYAQYLEEKTDRKILESEHGFVTYEITGEVCYIADIFTVREERLGGLAIQMCMQVGQIAKAAGCKVVIGTVQVENKKATEGLKACLAMGMTLQKAENGTVYLIREL